MTYKISDECISCGACAPECPAECISAGDDKYVINSDESIECGTCNSACPVDAPQPEKKLKLFNFYIIQILIFRLN